MATFGKPSPFGGTDGYGKLSEGRKLNVLDGLKERSLNMGRYLVEGVEAMEGLGIGS